MSDTQAMSAPGHDELVERQNFERWAADNWPNSNPPTHAWTGWQARASVATPLAAPGAGAVTEAIRESIKQIDAIIDRGEPTDWAAWRADLVAALRPEEAAGQGEAELAKLVEFFRGEGYGHFGWNGDVMGWSPAETAIAAMRSIIATPRPAPVAPDIVERFTSSNIMWSLDGAPLRPDKSGQWVRYTAHAEALAALSSELAEAKRTGTFWQNLAGQLQEKYDEWKPRAEAAEAEVARLTAREKELLEALEPFADFGGFMEAETEGFADTDRLFLVPEESDVRMGDLFVAAFRRARALQPAEKDSTDEA